MSKTNWREKNKIHLARYAQWYLYFSVVCIIGFGGGIIWDVYRAVQHNYYGHSFVLYFYAFINLGVSLLLFLAFLTIIELRSRQEYKTTLREKIKRHLIHYAQWYFYLSIVYLIAFAGGITWDISWIVKYHYAWNTFNTRILFNSSVFDLGASWLIYCTFLAIIDLT